MISLGLAALIGGIASAAAGITNGALAYNAQKKANETNLEQVQQANEAQMQQVRELNAFNAAEAQKARDWETEMSNTQIQRSMADYQAAGLNPLLAATNGATYNAPASASGSMASIKAGHVQPAALDLSGVASAFSSMTNFMLINKMLGSKGGYHNTGYSVSQLKKMYGANWKTGGFEAL